MEAGETVFRVNFCGSDVADWHHGEAINFSGRPEQWPAFLGLSLTELRITHVLLHGDRRYYHRVAADLCQERGIKVIATELGYLRPDWMTVERGGCSALSHFPIEPTAIAAIARKVGGCDSMVRFPIQERRRVLQELRFTFFNFLMCYRFPHYRSHRVEPRGIIYAGWIASRLMGQVRKRRAAATMSAIRAMGRQHYIFAMQLNGDLQIRENSPFTGMREAFDYVARSFSAHAPSGSLLIVKTHPLDHRQRQIEREISATASELGIEGRVVQIDQGDLRELCLDAAGFVSVNSTAGFDALGAGCPTVALLPTIYDIVGLCFDGGLDRFWTEGTTPDPQLLTDLRDAMAGTIQVRGTIYHAEGLREASRSIAQRLHDERINEPDAFVVAPPRLAKAAAMGVIYGSDGGEHGGSNPVHAT